MRKLLRTVLVCAIVMAAALVGFTASPASAAPTPSGLVTRSQYFYSSTVPGGVTGTLTCPSGYRLLNSGGGNAQILAEAPTADFTGATLVAAVFQQSPSNFAYLTITCAPVSQFSDVRTARVNDHRAQPGSFISGLARCPSGYYAFGGGGYFENSGSGFIGSAYNNVSNTPSADGTAWTFSGVTPSNANTLVTVVQCAPRTGRDVLVQFGNVSAGSARTGVYVNCPSGYTAISGGFYLSNPDGSEATPGNVIWSVPASQTAGVSSWYVNGLSPANTKVVSLAQCVR